MVKYKITYDRSGCISAVSCATLGPKIFEMDKTDNKANLIKGKKEGEEFVRIIDEKELEEALDAARSCPVNVIHIFNLETGERLV